MAAQAGERLLGDLVEASHLMSMLQVPTAVAEHARHAGFHDVLIYVVDLQQRGLHLMTGRDEAGPPVNGEPMELSVERTLAGRAFRNGESVRGHSTDGGLDVWWVPLLNGAERIGVLRACVDPGREGALRLLSRLADLTALLIVSKRPFSDAYAKLIRTQPMSVWGETQWRLMPPRNFSNDRLTIGAALEPAYAPGGDAFDYALAGDIVNLSIFDAVGHDTGAGLMADLAVAVARNSRIEGAGPVETGEAIETVLNGQFDGESYVTGLIADLDTRTGRLSWANFGHPAPVVIRGGRWVGTLDCPPSVPLGTGLGGEPTLCHQQIEPGDRVILYTDGIVETRSAEREMFGLERFIDFIIRHNADGLPVPETLRRLVHNILEYHEEGLDDDATVLLLEWHGGG
ncbi:PP2C family protein-serine/threonine phosphatase [Actinomadura sp. SCN-SB]|uniref:PP2C family protein-serine/threonine phosphatase n=1 Tax=Actinomadura sp. SCN-SB TaxID=3373092 RepID=UPI0037513F35